MKKFLSVLGFLSLFFILIGCNNVKVNVTFETNGGTAIEAITSLDDILGVLPTTTKDGYMFIGWYEDSAFTIPFEKEKERESWELTLYAKWIPLEIDIEVEHYLENLEGGYVLDTTETHDFDMASIAIDLSGYQKPYEGFSVNGALTVFDHDDIENLSLKLYYSRNVYTITIDEDGGTAVDDISVKYGYPITAPVLSKVGAVFNGYTTTFPETMPLNGGNYVASWTALDEVTVTFESNGGSAVAALEMYETEIATEPAAPTKMGYAFVGWYTESSFVNLYDFSTVLTTNLTLYAKWEPILVNFNIEYYYEELDGSFTKASTWPQQGFTDSTVSFTGSVLDSRFTYNPNHALTVHTGVVLADGSLTLKLYCERNEFTITFDTNANLSITSIVALFDAPIAAPNNPIRTNYIFMGWYSDEALTMPYSFSRMPGQNITLYARWLGVDTNLSFHSMGGTSVSTITAPLESVIVKPADPTREGFDFAGWFTDPFEGTEFTSWIMPEGNITLYAHWTPALYTLTFDSMGGNVIPSMEVEYQASIIKPENPVKTDYVFLGWFEDTAFTVPFDFSSMPAKDLTLYAKWISALEAS